jgi:hypothetical protein
MPARRCHATRCDAGLAVADPPIDLTAAASGGSRGKPPAEPNAFLVPRHGGDGPGVAPGEAGGVQSMGTSPTRITISVRLWRVWNPTLNSADPPPVSSAMQIFWCKKLSLAAKWCLPVRSTNARAAFRSQRRRRGQAGKLNGWPAHMFVTSRRRSAPRPCRGQHSIGDKME